MAGSGQLPLAGAILCCTSIAPEQRTQLAHMGAEMGAAIRLDLTSDATHLIVGNTDSLKYRYVAKCRNDVKVLLPTWLQAVRDVWLEGNDVVDVAALEEEYRLPTFYGLKICLTGIDNPEQRKYIQETVDGNGAEYHGDLTKAVTHLIAAAPTGKKYEHALNWRMKIVTLEWFEQSLERGMVLDESLFNPTIPTDQRGKGAWDRRPPMSPALGKRTRDQDTGSALDPLRRKLRRSASTKMGSQSQALWAGITAVNMDVKQNDEDDWTENSIVRRDDTLQETLAPPAAHSTSPNRDVPLHSDPAAVRTRAPQPQVGSADGGIFQGRVICPFGFDGNKTNILRGHLESNGARIVRTNELTTVSEDDLIFGFLVVPHDTPIDMTLIPDRAGSLLNVVSNWWVERCLHSKQLVDPADNVLNRPLQKLSINGFSGLVINSTGFAGIDLLHVTKAVALMGATYDEHLSAKTSVIVCNSNKANAQKIKFATDKRIPAVNATWLWDCVSRGTLQSYSNYQLNRSELEHPLKPRSKSSAAVTNFEVPVQKEDAHQSRQKKQPAAKLISRPLRPQNLRALDLARSAELTPDSTDGLLSRPDSNDNSFAVEQDEPGINGFDGNASIPLQVIGINSARRPSMVSVSSRNGSRCRSSSAESLIRAAPATRVSKADKKASVRSATTSVDLAVPAGPVAQTLQPPPKEVMEEKDYSDMLAQLRANRKAAPDPAEHADGKRRRRQLGRATSTRSNQSTGELSSGNLVLDDDDENSVLVDEYQPSQQLGWDSPGAAKARETMIKKLGGTLKDKSVPVQGIGIVRDVAGESMGRARRRRG